MTNFITFASVQDFFRKARDGNTLPVTWENDLLEYLKRKEKSVKRARIEYELKENQLNAAKRVYKYIKAKHGTAK